MSRNEESVAFELAQLYGLFGPADARPQFEPVPADAVPEPYHELLVHEHHMTVTVERHHGAPVDVRILASIHAADDYARKILLTLQGTDQVVQFGIVRIYFHFCSPEVQAEIVAGQTPLGRILITRDVLRRIVPTAFLRVSPDAELTRLFGLAAPRETFGRLALILCDGRPAIELLEIVAPE